MGDWLLTVPLLLMEIVLVMKIPEDELPGRWKFWCLSMIPFCYVVYTLLVGLKAATNSETDEKIRSAIGMAQWMTVISWLTYPVVYVIPMMGAVGAQAVVGIQVGYCISDIISKCGVGLFIYQISLAKSEAAKAAGYQAAP